jgi:hypothetical protein
VLLNLLIAGKLRVLRNALRDDGTPNDWSIDRAKELAAACAK